MRLTRSLAATAAASLTGAALALLAPSAAQAAVPPTADVYGSITVGGAPVANAEADLYGVNADGTTTFVGEAFTDASGQYWFDFNASDPNAQASDGVTTATGAREGFLDVDNPTQTSFKLGFFDDRDETRGQLDWQSEFTGDQPTLKRATPVVRATTGQTVVPAADLAVDSGAQGTVTVPVPAGYTYSGSVVAYDSDQQVAGEADFDNDPTNDATDPINGVGSFEFRNLYPGGDYTFQFFATATPTDPNSTADNINYVGSFYGDSTTIEGAKVVSTKPGQFATGINGTLTNVLVAKVKPSIKGEVAPGKKVKADHGTWSLTAQTTYSYQWLLNGKLVSTDDSYKLPKKHSLNKKLQLVVTAQYRNFAGSVAISAGKVKYAASLKANAKPTYVGGKKVVAVRGAVKVHGVKAKKLAKVLKGIKVTVYEVVGKGDDQKLVKLAKGKANRGIVNVIVKRLTAGKHQLEVDVTGKKIADIVRHYTVKI